MKIIIDTNIFCQDYHLQGTAFRLFLDGLSVIPASIYIPKIVIEEIVNRYKEDLTNLLFSIKKSQKQLKRLVPQFNDSIITTIKIDDHVDLYKTALLSKLQNSNCTIMPYPNISHELVIQQDLQRKKPFKLNGAGYRDFLIWQNIKNLVNSGIDQVVFITNNSRDFGIDSTIDPELRNEIFNPNNIVLYSSLKQFNELFIISKLDKLIELKKAIQNRTSLEFNVIEWINNNLINLLQDFDLVSIVTGLPDNSVSTLPSSITNLVEIDIEDVRKLESDDYYIRFKIKIDIEFFVSVDYENYITYPEVQDWLGHNEVPFSSISFETIETLDIKIDIVLDHKTTKVLSRDIISIEGCFGGIEE